MVTLAISTSSLAQSIDTPDTDVETQKRGQTGMKFLSTSLDARGTAIGGALTAELDGSSVSMFYNPASMAGMDGMFHASFNDLQFITDIHYLGASVAFRPPGGNYGVVGLSVTSVDYGEFIGTIRANNEQGFVETGNYSPTALAIGLGYARAFTDRFSAGAHVKYAYQNIGDGFVTTQEFGEQSGETFNPDAVTGTHDYSIGTGAVDFGVARLLEANEEQAFALKTLGRAGKPIARRATCRSAKGNLHKARMPTMQAAEKVHGIGEVACRMSTGCFKKGVEVAMTRGAFGADPRKMCFGNADR